MATAAAQPVALTRSEKEARNVAALHEMLVGFNSRNAQRMLAVFNEDMEWLDVPMEHSYRGHQEVDEFLAKLFIAFPDVTYELHEVVAEDDMLSAKFTMHGTHLGHFYGIPPTGRRVDLPCLSQIEMRDGKFVYDHCYFDTGMCLRQMGLMPPLSVTDTAMGRATFWLMVERAKVARMLGGALATALLFIGIRKVRNKD
ncbi:MAG TPA: nuclear transport factor 2 family protein [Thermomicrobiales bacterium]|nr:nuclear transport factor 2 family protein [Thermomicrobiales bacterium]